MGCYGYSLRAQAWTVQRPKESHAQEILWEAGRDFAQQFEVSKQQAGSRRALKSCSSSSSVLLSLFAAAAEASLCLRVQQPVAANGSSKYYAVVEDAPPLLPMDRLGLLGISYRLVVRQHKVVCCSSCRGLSGSNYRKLFYLLPQQYASNPP